MSDPRLHKHIDKLRQQHMPDDVITQAHLDALGQILKEGGIYADEDDAAQDGEREFIPIEEWDFMTLQEEWSLHTGRPLSWEEVKETLYFRDGRSLADAAKELDERIKQLRAQFDPQEDMTQEHFEALQQTLVDSGLFADMGETSSGGRVLAGMFPWQWDDLQEMISVQSGRVVSWDEILDTIGVADGRSLREIHEQYLRDQRRANGKRH